MGTPSMVLSLVFLLTQQILATSQEVRIRQIAHSASLCHQRLGELEEAIKIYTPVAYTFCERMAYSTEFDGRIAISENHKVHQKRWFTSDLWQAYPSEDACNLNIEHEVQLFKAATNLDQVLLAYCYRASSLNSLKWNVNIIANGESKATHYLTQLSFGGRVEADREEILEKVAQEFEQRGIALTSIHNSQEMIGAVIVAGYYKDGMKMYLNTNEVGDIETLQQCQIEQLRWQQVFADNKAIATYCVRKSAPTFELQILTLDENSMDSKSFRKLFTGGMYANRTECEANIITSRGFAQICARDIYSRQWGIHYFVPR